MQYLLFLSLFFVASVQGRPKWSDLHDYSFEKFIEDFKVEYGDAGSEKFIARKHLFEAELSRVRAHNALNLSWKEGINHFSAMTLSEKKSLSRGRSKGASKAHTSPKHELPFNLHLKDVSELPAEVDWRTSNVVSPVKDQGYCGSCWAFASTATIESHVALASGLLFDLSPQQITSCAPNPDSCGGTGGCYGATAEIAFDYIAGSAGMSQEFQYPYTSYYAAASACAPKSSPVISIDGYVKLPENNYTALMNAVAQVGPISISVDAAWGAYESGIFAGCNQASPDIDHAVVLVGYGEENGKKYWLVRNSWSPSWGEKGYIRLARFDTEQEVCGMDVTPQDGTACAGDNEPVKVCGTCGVLYDSAYPVGAKAL